MHLISISTVAAQLGVSNMDEMEARAMDLIDALNIYQYGCTTRGVKHGRDGSLSHGSDRKQKLLYTFKFTTYYFWVIAITPKSQL